MLYWIRFPLIRFLIFFIAGILLSRIINFSSLITALGYFALLAIFFILLFTCKKEKFLQYNFLIGITAFSALTLSGATISSVHNHRKDPHQLVNTENILAYLGKIEEVNDEDSLNTKFTLNVNQVKIDETWIKKRGKVQVVIKNNAGYLTGFHAGYILIIQGTPSVIKAPGNPDQFDYRQYMFYKGIYLQHYINRAQCIIVQNGSKINIRYLAGKLRSQCRSILIRHIPDRESLALVSALTLGLKDELNDEIAKDYARAGISHILAVSGLHVGIFYIILFVLLKPFNRNKAGAWVISGIIVSILIVFAFVTGLSPSVLRSVILFTFIETGRRLGRKSISFNTLAASALFLLIINPYFIYSAGFQLSYLAVSGIIFFQPYLYKLVIFTNDVADYIWKLVTVAIAAQITTFPITFYYFHTFPAYFMISNIIAIPAAFLILSLGLVIIGLQIINPVADIAGLLVSRIIHFFNLSIHSLASLPGSQFTGIRLSLSMVFLFYAIIFLVMMLMTHKKVRYIYGIAISGLALVLLDLVHVTDSSHREKIIFYSSTSGPLIELVSGRQGILITDSILYRQPEKIKRIIENHCIMDSHPCSPIPSFKLDYELPYFKGSNCGLYTWKGKSILITRDMRYLRSSPFNHAVKVDFLVITGNAGYDITNLARNFDPVFWIIDRSGYPAAREKAEKFLSSGKETYVSIEKTGAFSWTQ